MRQYIILHPVVWNIDPALSQSQTMPVLSVQLSGLSPPWNGVRGGGGVEQRGTKGSLMSLSFPLEHKFSLIPEFYSPTPRQVKKNMNFFLVKGTKSTSGKLIENSANKKISYIFMIFYRQIEYRTTWSLAKKLMSVR